MDTKIKLNKSNEDLTNYRNSNICIYCENECINKVLDHDHFTGKYRGPACT